MPDSSPLTSPGPYHILTYGTLLGTQLFHSFISGPIAYKTLPRPQFSSLQTALFPVYFSLQTALPVVLALTYPHPSSSSSPSSPGFRTLLDPAHRRSFSSALYPILCIFGTSLLNLVWIGPLTTRVMRERKHQETRDGKKSYDKGPHSGEMTALNRRFGRVHGASSALNLLGVLATVWYGVLLGGRL